MSNKVKRAPRNWVPATVIVYADGTQAVVTDSVDTAEGMSELVYAFMTSAQEKEVIAFHFTFSKLR